MSEPTENTDAGYEDSRRKAEQAFFVASVDWLDALVQEAGKLPIPPRPDAKKLLGEVCAAAWKGEPIKPPPPRRVSTDLVLKLVELCHKYGEAELRAYAELLERRGVPPSQAVNELDEHAEDTLREIHRRKWTQRVEHLNGLFDIEPWIEKAWHFVEERIHEFVRDDLHGWVWFHQDGWVLSPDTAEISPTGAPEIQSRRAWVDEFLLRCLQETPLRATRTHIWRAVGHSSARQFQFWQAGHPKATAQDDKNFRRILALSPTDFEALLKKKGII